MNQIKIDNFNLKRRFCKKNLIKTNSICIYNNNKNIIKYTTLIKASKTDNPFNAFITRVKKSTYYLVNIITTLIY